MKQVILNVRDNKYPFLMELLQNLKFVRAKKTIEEKEILDGFNQTKFKAKSMEQLLDKIELI
ncbi:hypothetical protein [Leptospira noguchii]|uniref:hypothetical protein n=1 Tax=Leptospira noguchii TaxID=28182 RepID=UPI000774AC05|nr:hypothetical protein [Leptospira noguchii]